MGFQLRIKRTEVTTVENGKTRAKKTADQLIDIPAGIVALVALIIASVVLEYQGEWLSAALEFAGGAIKKLGTQMLDSK